MSNTYFKIKKTTKEEVRFNSNELNTVESTISLTAFMGGKSGNVVQITTQRSGGNRDNYTTYIQLNKEEAIRLAGALLERASGDITATGYEKSNFKSDE